jgi:putative transposon-encoded protein
MKKHLCIVAIVSFALFAACSDDESVGKPANEQTSTVVPVPGESTSFVAGKGSCGGGHLAKRHLMAVDSTEIVTTGYSPTTKELMPGDSVEFIMKEDGSAVFLINTNSVCADYGKVTGIKLELQGDTLIVREEVETFPTNAIVEKNCLCFADYKVDVPAKYIGAKYLDFRGVNPIVYKEQE